MEKIWHDKSPFTDIYPKISIVPFSLLHSSSRIYPLNMSLNTFTYPPTLSYRWLLSFTGRILQYEMTETS